MSAPQLSFVRTCKNIKSRKNPDIQCPLPASSGDFCGRHSKNPTPHVKPYVQRPATRTMSSAAKIIRAFWRRAAPLKRFRSQGPAANDISLAINDTELYSLEKTESVPPIYRFSIADETKSIWLFDIRSLSHFLGKGSALKNPYNRTLFSPAAMEKLHARIAWLRKRRYQIIHTSTDILTPEQIWNQRVLDVFLKIEALGYYVNSDWFHSMAMVDHVRFYNGLNHLWSWRVGLTAADRERIVPGHATGRGLFPFTSQDYLHKSLRWWQTANLALIDAFVTRSADKEYNKLGTTYALMALVEVSEGAADGLRWVVDARNGL